MKVIVYDFEVYRYDTLLGVRIDGGYFQTWNYAKMKQFYQEHRNDIWIGHNNTEYDNIILQTVLKNKNPFEVSQDIVKKLKKYYLNLKLYYYDLMQYHPGSLKVIEAALGKDICETEVPFDIDRPLTNEERFKVETYNRHDLDQTFLDLNLSKSEFNLNIDLIKEFNLPLDALNYSQARTAEAALGVRKDETLIDKPVKPILYPQMKIKNQEVIDYYLSEGFRTPNKPAFTICGLLHQMGAGGIHAGRKKCHYEWAYYFDVSGYYNLVMINYDLFSRAMSEESKERYKFMYHEQLRLKKIDPIKRAIYKTILLAVFGAQMNEHSAFYDPWVGPLVPIVGQLFLVDLLEKLEGKVELVQSNTDGIIAVPLEGVTEKELFDIVNEWQARTGFVLKMDKITDIWQRDVNNYMYRDANGKIHTVGEAVKYYECWENPLEKNSFNSKEPIIIHYCIVDYFMNGVKPEQTIVKYSKNLRMFQWICKLQKYDYLTFEKDGEVTRLQKVNRCFASRESGMIYKNKQDKHDRYSNLSDNVFVWNSDLKDLDNKKIDYIYYARRAYERIYDFMNKESIN